MEKLWKYLQFKDLGYLVNTRWYVHIFLSFSFQPSSFTLASLTMGQRRQQIHIMAFVAWLQHRFYCLRIAYWLPFFHNRCHRRVGHGVEKPFVIFFVLLKSQLLFKGLKDLIYSPSLIFLGLTHVHLSLMHSSHSCLRVINNLTSAPKQS